MKLENWIKKQMAVEVQIMPMFLEACIDKYIKDSNFKCYMSNAQNGFPAGYAKTFKIISIKNWRKRK